MAVSQNLDLHTFTHNLQVCYNSDQLLVWWNHLLIIWRIHFKILRTPCKCYGIQIRVQKGFGHNMKTVERAQDVTKNKVANYRSHKEQYPKTDNRQLLYEHMIYNGSFFTIVLLALFNHFTDIAPTSFLPSFCTKNKKISGKITVFFQKSKQCFKEENII